jgi:basic amino acid/polyamine antiporter, APA family
MGIMRTKSVEQSIRDTEEPEFQLRKALGPLDLTVFGIGVIIGTGSSSSPERRPPGTPDPP